MIPLPSFEISNVAASLPDNSNLGSHELLGVTSVFSAKNAYIMSKENYGRLLSIVYSAKNGPNGTLTKLSQTPIFHLIYLISDNDIVLVYLNSTFNLKS